MSEIDLDELRSELSDFAQPEKKGGRSPQEEHIIAGFEEIQRFVEKHGRAPRHGEDREIFERLYAVRLDRLRALEECRSLLAPLDPSAIRLSQASCESIDGIRPRSFLNFTARIASSFASSGVNAAIS